MDVKEAVEAAKGGEVQFKAEKPALFMQVSAKPRSSQDKLTENVRAFVDAVSKAKPAGCQRAPT